MKARRFAQVLTGVVLVVAAGGTLGAIAGSLIRDYRERAALVDRRREVQNFLDSRRIGLKDGAQLPSIPLESADGSEVLSTDDLLPEGGLLLYLSADCGTCFSSLDALGLAFRRQGHPPSRAAVIAFGEPDSLEAYRGRTGSPLRTLYDAESRLFRDFGLATFPTMIVIDRHHRIVRIVAEARGVEVFEGQLAMFDR